ncbi:MAG: type IIA DNA topoisomerase subunit B [Bacteroidales bacterium]|nr:type IIA DNA topoisomerase subunit B [Bacteroidales bacterium]
MAEDFIEDNTLEDNELDFTTNVNPVDYNDDAIQHLSWNEHIRKRLGMYIGKAGDGSAHDDGIYILLKEIVDNSIDEFNMGAGKTIEIDINDGKVRVRDYGRGIPLGSLKDCMGQMNTGGKYNTGAFKKAVGLNGVGAKATNAASSYFRAQAFRDGQTKVVEFSKGELLSESDIIPTDQKNGTEITFVPDAELFGNYHFLMEYVDEMIWNYAFLNSGLTLILNGQKYQAKNGLLDLLTRKIGKLDSCAYPIIHIKEGDFECAFTHSNVTSNEEYFPFANGQYNPLGGTHLNVFREAIAKTIREFYNKEYETSDIRSAFIASLSIKVDEPEFEGQTKTKFSSNYMDKESETTIRQYITDIIKRHFDKFLHMNPDVAENLMRKIIQNEKERKGMANIKKLARESAKKVSLNNRKLRDCRIHYNTNQEKRLESTLFITEGDSASGSITKSRDAQTQAVFSLRGKPLNCYGLTKKIVYENEEFNLLQAALNIDESIENLRYNNIVIATDADVDGMHIRLLMLTFFLQFYPDVVRGGHLYILQTPLFRVRNKKETRYCYTDEERVDAIKSLGAHPEITRFKGLGEISPDEFSYFIGPNMRLEPIILRHDMTIPELLKYYMGKNTDQRQKFIIDNLRVEDDSNIDKLD